MTLAIRLILLIVGCLLPILAAQVFSQINLNDARQQQLRGLVLRQAELASADIGSILGGATQLGSVIAQFVASQADCASRLTALQQSLPQFRFLAIYARDGALQCGSASAPGGTVTAEGAAYQGWTSDRGALVTAGNPPSPFLPIGINLHPAAADPDLLLVAGLDTHWLARHLASSRLDHTQTVTPATIMVVDRNGRLVAGYPADDATTGALLPNWERPLIGRQTAGVETIRDPAGHAFLAAYIPLAQGSSGLAVIETMTVPDVTADIDRATFRDLLVIGGAAITALLLAWLAGRRFIYQPTEALLLAARRWQEGDLSARATLHNASTEFAALGQSFNAMAGGLQAREMERRMQASFLEAQVAERTRELSESNNRLQVEIAGREKTEAALHQAQKLQAVGQLAGGIAHDFNNMLATVLGNLELMERRVSQTEKPWTGSDNDRLMRLIGRATGAVQRGSQLTSRLLAFSRRQRLAARSTDVNALLTELITLTSSTLGSGVQVVPELADELWPAMVDPSQVEAAILNLCLNARDAMPRGGQLTISTANVTADQPPADAPHGPALAPGSFVRICISDSGAGMTAEVKARAFDPFFTTKGPHGSGLGLSQVYGMARQSGGDAIIDSTPGEGTRVTLLLPRAMPIGPTGTGVPQDSQIAAGQLPADLVLVVDDDAAVRQVTVEMIRDLGCEVAQAEGGDQALALLDTLSPPPALILLDYAMPGMNGLQLARALRQRGVTAPVALVTGFAELSEADIAEGQLAGLLRKPFTIGELHALLVRLRDNAAAAAWA